MERRVCADCGRFAIVSPLIPYDARELCFGCRDRSFGLEVGVRLLCAVSGCEDEPVLVGEENDGSGYLIVLCRAHMDEHIERFRRVHVLPGDIQRGLCDPNVTARRPRRGAPGHAHMQVVGARPQGGMSDAQ